MTKARDLANAGTALTTVSPTELGYLDGVTSAIQTQVDAKIAKTLTTTTGDIIYASGANTPARLGIGSSAQVLTVSGGIPSWATPSSGGVTQLATGTLSGSTVSITGISGDYKSLQLLVFNITSVADYGFRIALNTITSNYQLNGFTSSLFSGSGSNWGFNPASNFKSSNDANYFQMNLPNYTSSSPNAFVGDSVFSFLLSDNTTRFTGQATMANTSVSAAITRIDIQSGDTFNGGTYILNGIS
jgi:hypothetical protein